MFHLLPLLAAVTLGGAPPTPGYHGPAASSVLAAMSRSSGDDLPRVNVWTDRESPYQRGERARVYIRTDRDAYVTVFRVDTDGRIRVLFPIEPWDDNYTAGGSTFEVLGRGGDHAFTIDDYPGIGYLFAVASPDRFDYGPIVGGDHWDYRAIADGRISGDPYVALTDLASRIAPPDTYDYDIAAYDVQQHYDYPRFLCYDCHSYVSYSAWDPYATYCSRFRIEVYDDPYYYPYRYYGARGAVIVRPYRPAPRYVFKDWDGRGAYVRRVPERPRDPERRRIDERGRGGADFGGRGAVPVPGTPRIIRDSERNNDWRAPEPDRTPARRPEPVRPSIDAGPTRIPQPPEPRRREPAVEPPRPVVPQPRPPVIERREEPRRLEPAKPAPRPESIRPPPRAEPQRAPRPEARPAPPPKGTGEPTLRRRKPN